PTGTHDRRVQQQPSGRQARPARRRFPTSGGTGTTLMGSHLFPYVLGAAPRAVFGPARHVTHVRTRRTFWLDNSNQAEIGEVAPCPLHTTALRYLSDEC